MDLHGRTLRKEKAFGWLNDEGWRLFRGWYTQMYNDYGDGYIPSIRETQIMGRIIAAGNPDFSVDRLRQCYRLKDDEQDETSSFGPTPSEDIHVANFVKSTAAPSPRSSRILIHGLPNAHMQVGGLTEASNLYAGQNQGIASVSDFPRIEVYAPIQSTEKKRLTKKHIKILEDWYVRMLAENKDASIPYAQETSMVAHIVRDGYRSFSIQKLRLWCGRHRVKGTASGSTTASKDSEIHLSSTSATTPEGKEPSLTSSSSGQGNSDQTGCSLNMADFIHIMPNAVHDDDPVVAFGEPFMDEQEKTKIEQEGEALERMQVDSKGEVRHSQGTDAGETSFDVRRYEGVVTIGNSDVEQVLTPSQRKQISAAETPRSQLLSDDDPFHYHAIKYVDDSLPSTWSELLEWMDVRGASYERLYNYAAAQGRNEPAI